MANFRSTGILILLLALIMGLSLVSSGVHLLTEAWWFESVGFSPVFWTRLLWQLGLGALSFTLYSLFLWGNYRLALYRTRDRAFALPPGSEGMADVVVGVAILLIAAGAATSSLNAWETLLKFLHASQFGSQDPIFNRDISFYTLRLPLYEGLHHWLLGLLLAALCLSVLVYTLKGSFTGAKTKAHLSWLLGALALLGAWGFWLERYHLLYSRRGIVFGAGYTDVHARLLAYGVMAGLCLVVAILFIFSARRRSFTLPVLGVVLSTLAFVVLGGVYPWLVQEFSVAPNELAKEKPYLAHNIQFTQAAYRLKEVEKQNYAATAPLDRQALQSNQSTIDNIRLWDYRPLLITYRQLQEIRLYYQFLDVDVDRYTLNGNYQQMMLSARELSFERLPPEAQTWVNRHLKYTHGYGLVMSPAARATTDGLPELYLKDIPPVSPVGLKVEQPAIYYGEGTNSYVLTGTTTEEFDYPLGDANALTRYRGRGGVALSDLWRRLAYAYDLNSLQLLISNYLTPQSRLHYYRQVRARIHLVAPFLRLDGDPYLVLVNGKLQWIVDAYTVSDRYPYSEPSSLKGGQPGSTAEERLNYIRNSVKVLVDAYEGTLHFLVVDGDDPILATYRSIFPTLFEPATAIPPAVKAHFRYPQDLFKMQAQIYLAYHMSEPEAFYNREDLWQLPLQTYEGNEQVMEPYYMILRLPGEEREGFILILPFTPAGKDNMIAWMAARSNGKDYGKLLLYEFPKQRLVYGPRQIEARIDQDTKISQQFTLWSQSGSKVIRGDLLVIPIDQSLLYVEPVYLKAEKGELPQLQRVIVVYDRSVAMTETLDQSLAAIFGGERLEEKLPIPRGESFSSLARSALLTYEKAQEALRQGNWADYGRYQQELAEYLRQLNANP